MKLVYTPDDGARQEWEVQLGKLRVAECEAIEARTGWSFATEFREQLLKANTKARRAMLWTLQRREHHTLRYDDVDFAADEVVLEFDLGELTEIREALDQAPMPEVEKAMALAAIDANIAELKAADAASVAEGKDLPEEQPVEIVSLPSETSTRSRSRRPSTSSRGSKRS